MTTRDELISRASYVIREETGAAEWACTDAAQALADAGLLHSKEETGEVDDGTVERLARAMADEAAVSHGAQPYGDLSWAHVRHVWRPKALCALGKAGTDA